MPEMQRLVVDVQGWMSAAEYTQLFAVAQAAPGPNVLVTALIGWKVAGVAGGAGRARRVLRARRRARLFDRRLLGPHARRALAQGLPARAGADHRRLHRLRRLRARDAARRRLAAARSSRARAAAILYLSKLNPLWILAGGGLLGYFLF